MEKAYCLEMDKIVSPYEARDYYFSDEHETKEKLTFYCPDPECLLKITSANIYKQSMIQRAPHFKIRPKTEHEQNCTFYEVRADQITKEEESGTRQRKGAIKSNVFPTELSLEPPTKTPPKTKIASKEDEDLDIEKIRPRVKRVATEYAKTYSTKTRSFENVVDCFEQAVSEEDRTSLLTINDKTKYYKNFFKPIKYFSDEEGLIYYGEIEPIKPYGKNYSITFKDKVFHDGNYIKVAMYITHELIQQYRKKKFFIETIEQLAELELPASCYFVGAYPKLKTVNTSKTKQQFDVFNVDIANLDHLVIKFTEKGR